MTDEQIRKNFAKNLSFYMYDKRINQKELADAIGVSQQAVSFWLNGTMLPRVGKINAIASYFGVTRNQLLDGDDITNANDLAFRSLREAGYYDLTEEDREAVARLVKSLADARRGR